MGTDDADVLSFGRGEPGRPWWLPVIVVGALLIGFLAGSRDSEPVGAAARPSDARAGLVAGVVRERYPIGDDLAFEVVLSNGSGVPLGVVVQAVGPVEVLQPEGPERVPAHASRTVALTVPTTCDGRPGSMSRLTAVVSVGSSWRRVEVPVLDAGDLRAYWTALCAPTAPESATALEGVWSVDRAFARSRSHAPLLLWFRPDRRFAGDDQGRLFEPDPAVTGDYRVRGDRLHLVARGGSACPPGDVTVWAMHRRSTAELALRYVSGACPAEPGGVWVLRRLLRSVPAGVTW